ncbi:VWA domain-containing protein [Stieleria varia]|uniref:von Willebrand factor type A domain protein n=1 Tax=Stieleria varia TaxID=2528005 RepID=A0A5C6ALE4_9BACT|nr:VWA domain-containing protein [Stieleria varia]TWU00853.1 von Willebrand factor type A domain protein [Stieleria varia]
MRATISSLTTIFTLLLCIFATGNRCQAVEPATTAETQKIAKILAGRSDTVRLRTALAIDQNITSRVQALPAMSDALNTLIERLDEKDREEPIPPGVAQLISTLSKVDRDDAVAPLSAAVNAPSIAWATFTIDAVGQNKHHSMIPELVDAFDGPLCSSHYGLRFALVRSLLLMQHPDALEALGRLRTRIDGQLRHKLDVELDKLTVDDFWGDDQRFAAWTAGDYLKQPINRPLSPDSMFKSASYSESANRMRLTRQKYYDIDIYAKRLLFVIDRSGSMAQVGYRGTRIAKAKQELIAAIRGLEPDTEFSILVFDTDIRAYSESLQIATDENKQKAIRYVSALNCGKKTNTYGALRRAIEFDYQLEAIFVLTDGRPTTGQVVVPELILTDILQRNQFRNITINTVAIAAEESLAGFLQGLTTPSGGEYRVVD